MNTNLKAKKLGAREKGRKKIMTLRPCPPPFVFFSSLSRQTRRKPTVNGADQVGSRVKEGRKHHGMKSINPSNECLEADWAFSKRSTSTHAGIGVEAETAKTEGKRSVQGREKGSIVK